MSLDACSCSKLDLKACGSSRGLDHACVEPRTKGRNEVAPAASACRALASTGAVWTPAPCTAFMPGAHLALCSLVDDQLLHEDAPHVDCEVSMGVAGTLKRVQGRAVAPRTACPGTASRRPCKPTPLFKPTPSPLWSALLALANSCSSTACCSDATIILLSVALKAWRSGGCGKTGRAVNGVSATRRMG